MDIANNWTIIAGVVALISMIFYWSKQAYLDPIVKREQEIKKKVKDDIIKKLDEYKSIIEEKGEEEFVDDVYDIIEFKKDIRDLKDSFAGKMIPYGLGVVFLSIIIVSTWSFDIWISLSLVYVVLFLMAMVIGLFIKMKRYENRISRYLEGENPTRILDGSR